MDARPLLSRIARMLEEHGLEAVLIGNAGFMFRKTPANLCKLKALAAGLDAVILRPYYPACADLFRMVRDDDGLQIDFVSSVHGVRFLASLRRRSDMIEFGQTPVVASLRTNVPVPEPVAKKPLITRKAKLEALKKETELALRDQIRRLQALPPDRRTNFLRKRVAYHISCL